MDLASWLTEQNKKAEQFGRELGVSGQAVRRWCSGERMPDATTIESIRTATNDQVTVQDLHATRLQYVKEHGTSSSGEAA